MKFLLTSIAILAAATLFSFLAAVCIGYRQDKRSGIWRS